MVRPNLTQVNPSGLVKLNKLETSFSSDPQYTEHIYPVHGERHRKEVERWVTQQRLGHGSYGVVFLEKCTLERKSARGKKGELRAIKSIRKPASRSDYVRELEAITLFSHPGLDDLFVQFFGWYENEEDVFIAMEYLPNRDLEKCIQSPLPEKEGRYIILQMLQALHEMHKLDYSHRDLKPSNVLVVSTGPNWHVKIADFGVSKQAIEGVTALRTSTGTPAFHAPKLNKTMVNNNNNPAPDPTYTSAVDLWSVGAVAFWILTNEFCLRTIKDRRRYCKGILAFPSATLKSLAEPISDNGCEFIENLMASSPDRRPTAEEALNHPWLDTRDLSEESMHDCDPPDTTKKSASPATDRDQVASDFRRRRNSSGAMVIRAATPPQKFLNVLSPVSSPASSFPAAAQKGHDSTVKMLIEAGTVLNAQALSSSGFSAKGNFTVTFREVTRVIRVMIGKKIGVIGVIGVTVGKGCLLTASSDASDDHSDVSAGAQGGYFCSFRPMILQRSRTLFSYGIDVFVSAVDLSLVGHRHLIDAQKSKVSELEHLHKLPVDSSNKTVGSYYSGESLDRMNEIISMHTNRNTNISVPGQSL